jgi:hypothetical protein
MLCFLALVMEREENLFVVGQVLVVAVRIKVEL